MMKAAKVIAMVAIATLVGVGLAYAATYEANGIVTGSGGGIVVNGVSTDSTDSHKISFTGTTGGRIAFNTNGNTADDSIQFLGGSDSINFGSGIDHLLFGDDDDYIQFAEGSAIIYFGNKSSTTGHNSSHYLYYNDVEDVTDDYEQKNLIEMQAPTIELRSYNERDPESTGDDYAGATIEIDPQNSSSPYAQTGDVIITLGAGDSGEV